jgi:hypothetical protein
MISILDFSNMLDRTDIRCQDMSMHIVRTNKPGFNKMEFYNKLGFNEYSANYPDIIYYSPNESVCGANTGGGNDHIRCRSELQIFYETGNFDIVIGGNNFIRNAKIYINDNNLGSHGNDVKNHVKLALKKCIMDIMDEKNKPDEISELRAIIAEQAKQFQMFKSKLMDVFISDSIELETLKKENEELKRYKKIMDDIINAHSK